jgi:hypothetical protein
VFFRRKQSPIIFLAFKNLALAVDEYFLLVIFPTEYNLIVEKLHYAVSEKKRSASADKPLLF